jgi:hypothetical protein
MRAFPIAAFLPVAVATALVLGAGPGCNTSCDDAVKEVLEVTSGVTDPTGSVYESSAWEGEYLEFVPQRKLRFFHGLRGIPRSVQVYIGFHPAPLTPEGGRNISEAAGNIAIIEEVNAEYVQIRNDTCETFYTRLVAANPTLVSDPDGSAGAPSL